MVTRERLCAFYTFYTNIRVLKRCELIYSCLMIMLYIDKDFQQTQLAT